MPSDWRRGRCQALWLEQDGACFFCGRPMPEPLGQRLRHRPEAATIEHVQPRALGGPAEWNNEVAACRACNSAKADRPPNAEELARLARLKRS